MSVTVQSDQLGSDPGSATLGDVLYANTSRTRVSEAEWCDLVRGIAAGDQRALHSLYGRMHRLVFTLTLRLVADRATAEELTVDVFYDVWRRAGSFDPGSGTVVGWIMNQARSRAIDRLRFEQRKKRTNPHPQEPQTEVGADSSVGAFEATEQAKVLNRALRGLSPEERQAIESAFFSECTHAEVAAKLQQPLGTVKTRIRAGLGKLRQALAKEVEDP